MSRDPLVCAIGLRLDLRPWIRQSVCWGRGEAEGSLYLDSRPEGHLYLAASFYHLFSSTLDMQLPRRGRGDHERNAHREFASLLFSRLAVSRKGREGLYERMAGKRIPYLSHTGPRVAPFNIVNLTR